MSRTHVRRILAHLAPGDHLCCLYETDEEHRAVVVPFLRQGLEQDQRAVYIVDAHTAETILGYLRQDGLDVEPYLARGQLAILTSDETYLRAGVFDPDSMIALLRAQTKRARVEGFAALRVTGDMTWAQGDSPGSERFIEYEAKLNEFFAGSLCLAICQYDRRRFEPATLFDVLRTHPKVLIGTELYDNNYYIPPKELLGHDPHAAEFQSWIHNLAESKRTQCALRESEERFRSAFEHAGIGMALVGLDGEFLMVNDAACDMLGYSRSELLSMAFTDITHPEDLAEGQARYEALLSGASGGYSWEKRYIHHEGHTLWGQLTCSLVRGGRGQPLYAIAQLRNIDSRKRAAEALRESEALHREAQRVAHIGHWELIPEIGTPTWSDEIFRIFGLDPNESEPSFAAHQDLVHPDDWDILNSAVTQASTAGTPFDIEFRLLRPNGEIRWMGAKGRTTRNDEGRVTRLFGTAQDITLIKQAEAQIRFQAMLLDAVGQAVIATDPEGAITYWNRAAEALYGWTQDEVLGRNVMEVTVPRLSWDEAVEIMEHLKAGRSWSGEFPVQRRDGSSFPSLVTDSPVLNREGELVGIIGVSTDITEHRQAEAQLQALLRDKELLLQEVHHRVKNNLQIIASLLDLQAEAVDDPQVLETLQDSKHRVRSMAMIHETLYQSADLAQFSLADYLHELTDYLLGAYGRTTSNLVLDVQVAPVSLALDQAIPCGLIVTELVSNSLKHAFSSADDEPAGPRGRLKVSLHSQDGQVELVVRDDGAGLPTDLQVHAVDSLGLRLVDLLTQQLRGTLDVESKADQGSAFCIRFPTQEEKERQPEARNAPGLRRRGDG